MEGFNNQVDDEESQEPQIEEKQLNEPIEPTQPSISHSEEAEESPVKRFKHLSRLSKLLEKEETRETITTTAKYDLEFSHHTITDEERRMDPLDYWVGKLKYFPVLAPVACDILAVPASTVPVERIFSTGGEATCGKQNRLTENLEREIFIKNICKIMILHIYSL